MKVKALVKARWVVGMFLALRVGASAWAQTLPVTSPLEKLESLQGSAVVRKAGQVLVVTLPSQDGHGRWFRVEADQGASLPAGFRADAAQVHYWMGHLVLIADEKAWHFSIPGHDAFLSDAAQVPDAAEVAGLTRGFDLKEVQVSALYSASGPRANRLNEGLKNIFANDIDHSLRGSRGAARPAQGAERAADLRRLNPAVPRRDRPHWIGFKCLRIQSNGAGINSSPSESV